MGGQYNNKNGNLQIKDYIKLIHSGELDEYMREFKLTTSKCPPEELIHKDTQCFYCMDCFRQCASRVKEYKGYYKADGQKFEKTDIEGDD